MRIQALAHFKQLFEGPQGRLELYLRLLAHVPFVGQAGKKTSGHLSHLEGLLLQRFAAQVPEGGTIVEVGSFLGKSCVYMGSVLRKRGVKIYCVDTWNNDAPGWTQRDVFPEFTRNTQSVKEVVVPLRGDSETMAKNFDKPIDLLFIDGDHSYEGCSKDIAAWLPKVVPNGTVCFHDYTNPCGVRESVTTHFTPHCQETFLLDSIFSGKVAKATSPPR